MTSIRHNGLDSARPAPDSARPTPDSTRSTREDALLDAAREAILTVGWSRTTLTDIARRAGVSRMTLYRTWPDMSALLADLMTREWTRIAERAVREGPGTALDALVAGLLRTLRELRANDLLGRIIDVDPELLLPYLLERRGRSQELVAGLLAQQIRAGQRDGSIRTGDADVLARSIVLAAHGFTLSAHTMLEETRSRGADVSGFDRELATLVERYLRP